MRFIELNLARPDFESIRAASELLADGYTIVFPSDLGLVRLSQYSGDPLTLGPATRLIISEDYDRASLTSIQQTIHMPPHAPNRAFHTLVQLCDFALMADALTGDEEQFEYGFREMPR